MNRQDRFYEEVHNYTKYKLVEMLIDRFNDGKTKVDDLNSIEDLADDVLQILAVCGGCHYYETHMKIKVVGNMTQL